jgi:hypothetical protein
MTLVVSSVEFSLQNTIDVRNDRLCVLIVGAGPVG